MDEVSENFFTTSSSHQESWHSTQIAWPAPYQSPIADSSPHPARQVEYPALVEAVGGDLNLKTSLLSTICASSFDGAKPVQGDPSSCWPARHSMLLGLVVAKPAPRVQDEVARLPQQIPVASFLQLPFHHNLEGCSRFALNAAVAGRDDLLQVLAAQDVDLKLFKSHLVLNFVHWLGAHLWFDLG
eukprot:CAMPEP_0113676550 /NCGR_PEP_ID=MMETSP0038_2-20120614/8705_1 /TAXON_ID=2898 /ORGANISM="Cryptomonas paramecium" /LENGTH=184 /DNA_ID=CAMNT_0000593591 /DNA_START=403 /DNA_END=958 /DNA_ORIENTATION=+ /assembly_acc=CAM_ASM_000170